jgi:enoyl-CoA hydratase/carnithine racemase
MADYETIRYETSDGLATITLSRPDKRNAMNRRMFKELGDAADRVAADPEIRGVLVDAAGPSFCAGIDLTALTELAGIQGDEFRSFVRLAQRPYAVLAGMAKPSVAAVQGHALGAGFQLALACDLRVASTDASFAMLEARYGLIPDLGGSHHLARLIGPARAKEVVWSARPISAEEAQRIGLVNRVCDAEALTKEAEALLHDVTAHSPVTAGLTKALIDRAHETPLEVELDREADAQATAVGSADHREAVAAFLERRQPRFQGE